MTFPKVVNHDTKPNPIMSILIFPFQLLWLLLRIAFLSVLILEFSLAAYVFYRASQPMVTVPEQYRGYTLRELLRERGEALDARAEQIGTIEATRDVRICKSTMYGVALGFSYLAPTGVRALVYKHLFPNSFLSSRIEDPDYYEWWGKDEFSWIDLMDAIYRAIEYYFWKGEVVGASDGPIPACRVGYPLPRPLSPLEN